MPMRRKGLVGLTLLGLTIWGTSAVAGPPEIPPDAKPLTGAEIHALLDGKSYSFIAYDSPLTGTTHWDAGSGTVSGDYVWDKKQEGTFEAKWFVENDRSCTQQPDQEPACQIIYLHKTGFIEMNADGTVHAVSVPVP